MFDFLQNLSHQHPKKQQKHQGENQQRKQSTLNHEKYQKHQNQEKNSKTVAKPSKNNKPAKLSLSAQLQKGDTATLEPQTLRMLEIMGEQSSKWMNDLTFSMATELRAQVERKVYLRQMSHSNEEYLEQILIQSSSDNRFIRHGLAQIVDTVAGAVMDDIAINKYNISKKLPMNKDELFLLEKSFDQIRSKDGNLRQKVGELKMQLKNQAEKIDERSEDIVNKKSYSINDPKTKKVQKFLKEIQFDRSIQRQKYLESLEEDKRKRKQRELKMEMAREKAQSQRHERLVEAYEMKRKIKKDQKFKEEQRSQQFKQWMKAYKKKKPLYKQLQDRYVQNIVVKDHDEKMRKMIKIKDQYGPLDFDGIEDHQERYQDVRKEYERKRDLEKRMKKKAEEERKKQFSELHKGEFRYYVLEQMLKKKEENEKDPRTQMKIKKARELAYSQNVKVLHKPSVSETKRRQSQSFIQPTRKKERYGNKRMRLNEDGEYTNYSVGNIKGNYEVEKSPDAKEEGERNRRYLKQYIRQKIENGMIKEKDSERKQLKTVETRPNYLEEFRKNKNEEKNKKLLTIDHEIESLKKNNDIRILKAKAEQYDERIKRKQKKIDNQYHSIENKMDIEDDYLFSIKAKMEIIKNFN